MTLTFVCQNCDDSFEMDYTQLVEEARGLRCPNCSKKLPATTVDEFVTTLDDLLSHIAALRKRFLVSLEIDAEELPPPYDTGKRARAAEDEEEEEEVDTEDEEEVDEEPLADEDEDERY